MPRPIERDETATSRRTVLAIVDNLLDAVPISEAGRMRNLQVIVARAAEAVEACVRESPRLIVLDLAAPEAVSLLRNPSLRGIPTVGFYPHVRPALRARAIEAGLGRALPRSAFFDRLPEVLGELALGSRLPEADMG